MPTRSTFFPRDNEHCLVTFQEDGIRAASRQETNARIGLPLVWLEGQRKRIETGGGMMLNTAILCKQSICSHHERESDEDWETNKALTHQNASKRAEASVTNLIEENKIVKESLGYAEGELLCATRCI